MRRLIYFFLKIRQHPHCGGAFPLCWPETLGPVAEPGGLSSPAQLPQNQVWDAFSGAPCELRGGLSHLTSLQQTLESQLYHLPAV